MASIERRPDGKYLARWREYPGGPQKTRQFARKGDADRFPDGLRGDLAHGVYIDPAGGRILFRDYAEQWRAGQVHRPNTATQAKTYLRLHAYPTLGCRPIGSIRRNEVQAWVKERSSALAPGSVELVYRPDRCRGHPPAPPPVPRWSANTAIPGGCHRRLPC